MESLYERLAALVTEWRGAGYTCPDYPAIQEILEFAHDENGELRFLRPPQFKALETYWYLRLVKGTPHVFDLYEELFGDKKINLIDALGVPHTAFEEVDVELDALWQKVKTDDDFMKRHQLHALRETLALVPS